MVNRGNSSLSYLYSAAQTIEAEDKPAHICYIGDYTPWELTSPQHPRSPRGVRSHSDITFEIVAVTPEQIEELELPTRPTKKTAAAAMVSRGRASRLTLSNPDVLRTLCRECIELHIDQPRVDILKLAEESERDILMKMRL
jgi:hypothetical protein